MASPSPWGARGGANDTIKGHLVDCNAAEFDSASPPDAGLGVTVFVISDSSRTLHAEYPALHATRSVVPVGDGGWFPGAVMTLTWSPATDVIILVGDGGFEPPSAWVEYDEGVLHFLDGGSAVTLLGAQIQMQQDSIQVTLPADAGIGQAILNLSVGSTVSASRCDGLAACLDYTDRYSLVLPIEIQSR